MEIMSINVIQYKVRTAIVYDDYSRNCAKVTDIISTTAGLNEDAFGENISTKSESEKRSWPVSHLGRS